MRYHIFYSVQFPFTPYVISTSATLDTHSLICPFYINTENEPFSHVNTQITVARGTIKLRTSGLFFLSYTLTQAFIQTHTLNTNRHTHTCTRTHVRAKPGFCTPSVPLRFSFKRSANTHVVGSDYTGYKISQIKARKTETKKLAVS